MISESHPLHRMFRGLTESTFMTELGVGDPTLVDYVSNLLATFAPSRAHGRIRDKWGRPLLEVVEMLIEAESTDDEKRRAECHQHVGDFTLFWTGVYPEALRRPRGAESADRLIDYQIQGKRSYYLAGALRPDDEERSVLLRLSEEFELCAYGLSQVRREWEKLEAEAAAGGAPTIWT